MLSYSQQTETEHEHDGKLLAASQVHAPNLGQRKNQHPNVKRDVDTGVCQCEVDDVDTLSSRISCPKCPGQTDGIALKQADEDEDDAVHKVEDLRNPQRYGDPFAGQMEDSKVHEENRCLDDVDAGMIQRL